LAARISINETSHYGEVADYLSEYANESFRKHTVANAIIKRSPLSVSGISIIFDQNGTFFGKTSTGHSDKPIYREIYRTPIDDKDYTIDASNKISLTPEFEESVGHNIERFREISEYSFYLEGDFAYWPHQYDRLIELGDDPFNILFYLIEKNSDSFRLEKTKTEDIVYKGMINPDTLVDYYKNDGSGAFEGLFYGYAGEMTREALTNEMMIKDYSAMIEPLNALLFTEEHSPITILKNPADNTYAITIVMTAAKNALYEKMYYTSGFSIIVDESTVEYKNITAE